MYVLCMKNIFDAKNICVVIVCILFQVLDEKRRRCMNDLKENVFFESINIGDGAIILHDGIDDEPKIMEIVVCEIVHSVYGI